MTKDQLKPGQSMLTRVRKINKVANDPSKGYNLQIELAEPLAERSMLSRFLPTDDRIIKAKAQLAWSSIEPEAFAEIFQIPAETMNKINALPVSTGAKTFVEGQNILSLNMLNPTVDGNVLRVQIVETTVKPEKGVNTPKINPKTGAQVLHQGLPIYRIPSIVNYKPNNVLLSSDPVEVPVAEPQGAKFMAPNIAAAVGN